MSMKQSSHQTKLEYGNKTFSEKEHNYSNNSSGKKNTTKAHLDDFIYELQERNEKMSTNLDSEQIETLQRHLNSEGGGQQSEMINVTHLNGNNHEIAFSSQQNYSSLNDINVLLEQLAQKEKDLILAAEIGKTLLDRNEELTKTNLEINEEYTRNLELLEQEKYALRKKLNTIEIEYENKIHELQSDLHNVREKLNAHFEISKQNEAENSRIIEELTEQNQRLTSELKRKTNRETALEHEIQSLKEQFHARRINFSDHIGQIEGLRDEINLLSQRKFELENKISSLNDEKEAISLMLDETQFKILQLEKHLHQKEMFIESQQKDLDELRRMNTHYQNRIESMIKNRSFDSFKIQGSSLLNEIEMSSHSSGEENNFHYSPNYFSEEEIDIINTNGICKQCFKYKHEMIEIYYKLKTLFDDLCKRRMNEPNVPANLNLVTSSNHDSGIQNTLTPTDEVNYILCDIQELVKNFEVMQCITCLEFNAERLELERIRKQSQLDRDAIQKLNSQVIDLTSRLTIHETKMEAFREENIKLKDDIDSISNASKDDIIKRAWKMRDDVIARKNKVEIELAKVRIELMNVNSQLLETIQQKVELSQQLDQWQVDMETLIDEQLKNKLNEQEKNSTITETPTNNKKENLFERLKFSKLLRYP